LTKGYEVVGKTNKILYIIYKLISLSFRVIIVVMVKVHLEDILNTLSIS
jgi:hypothetical protein